MTPLFPHPVAQYSDSTFPSSCSAIWNVLPQPPPGASTMGAQIRIIHQPLSARHKLNSRFIEMDKAIMSGLSPARHGFESLYFLFSIEQSSSGSWGDKRTTGTWVLEIKISMMLTPEETSSVEVWCPSLYRRVHEQGTRVSVLFMHIKND